MSEPLNFDYLSKVESADTAAMSMLEKAPGFLAASVTDAATSLWNSAVSIPEYAGADMSAYKADTRKIVESMGKDVLSIYDESKDAVETASFLGGALVPGMLAVKLLNRTRLGLESAGKVNAAVDVFSGVRKAELSSLIAEEFTAAGAATKTYKSLSRQMLGLSVANAIVDTAAIEFATIGMLSAHPWMEDYAKDPIKNFAISMAFGAGAMSLLSIPGVRNDIRKIVAPIEGEAIGKVYARTFNVPEGVTTGQQVAMHDQNARSLQELIKDEATNGLTKEIAGQMLLRSAASRETLFKEMTAGIDAKELEALRPLLLEFVTSNSGLNADRINVAKFREGVQGAKGTSLNFTHSSGDILELTKMSAASQAVQAAGGSGIADEVATVFYRPSTKTYFLPKDIQSAGLAVDIRGVTVDGKRVNVNQINNEIKLENLGRVVSSADRNLEYLDELKKLSSMDITDFKNFVLAPDQLPRLNALVSRLPTMTDAERSLFQVKLRNEQPSFSDTVTYIEQKASSVGVTKDHLKLTQQLVGENSNSLYAKNLSPGAATLLRSWQEGSNQSGLRPLMDAALRGQTRLKQLPTAGLTGSALQTATEHNVKQAMGVAYAKELWNKGAEARALFKKLADPEGYVYLYRGVKGKTQGSGYVDSFTVDPSVASAFGSPTLVRVNTENIIGIIGRHPSGYPGMQKEMEVIVGSPSHNVVTGLPQANAQNVVIKSSDQGKTLTANELYSHLVEQTELHIKELSHSGGEFSIDEIAARLAIKREALQAHMLTGVSLNELDWRMYTDAGKITSDYLNPTNSLLRIKGNPQQIQATPFISMLSALDARSLQTANGMIVSNFTNSSPSFIGKELAGIYQAPEMQQLIKHFRETDLTLLNNANVGSPFWQSADMMLRHADRSGLLTALGKRFTDTTDKVTKDLLEDVALGFMSIKNNPALLARTNLTINVMNGLRGWRDIVVDEVTGWAQVVQRAEDGSLVAAKLKDGTEFVIKEPEIVAAFNTFRRPGNAVRDLIDLNRKIEGRQQLDDLGLYFPPPNLVGKHFSYLLDNSGKTRTEIIIATSAEELADIEKQLRTSKLVSNSSLEIVNRGQNQEYFNSIHAYEYGGGRVTVASQSKLHAGASGQAVIPGDTRFIEDIIRGFEGQLLAASRKNAEHNLTDILGPLRGLSDFYQKRYSGLGLTKGTESKALDAALSVRNILLGRDQLEQSVIWNRANSLTEIGINRAAQTVNNTWNSFAKSGDYTAGFTQMEKELAAKGVPPVFKDLNEYILAQSSGNREIAQRLISTANGFVATLQLRFFDLAQAAVNIMSLPIMTNMALRDNMPVTATNAAGGGIKFPARYMHDGLRAMNSPEGRIRETQWLKDYNIDNPVRQYTDIVNLTYQAALGNGPVDKALDTMNRFMKSRLVENFAAKPADFAEKFTRTWTMHTGFGAAKQAYPGISDAGATIYAVKFSDRAVGNYYPSQRPTLFQGSLGSAIGLYQTYMWTFAQNIYRQAEGRDFKAMLSTMLTQAGIFGMASMPGYSAVSGAISSHYSAKNYDITTGTYRALPDPMAEIALYGLPSSIGPALYTRGDLAPRVPGLTDNLAMVQGVAQIYNTVANVVGKMASNDGTGKIQGMLEGLSMQSLNRPVARLAEIMAGTSVNSKGNTVATKEDVWTPMGVFARLLSTRPIEEQVLRNAAHLDQFYGQVDYNKRQDVVKILKTAIRAGNVSDDLLSKTASDYILKGGTARGWASAMNDVFAKTEAGTRYELLRKLEPDSPLRRMIDDNF